MLFKIYQTLNKKIFLNFTIVQYLPLTDGMLKEVITLEVDRGPKLVEWIKKVVPLRQKMSFDTKNRMDSTLNILRACRMLNYKFIASTPQNALTEEIEQLQRIPCCILMMKELRVEIVSYRIRATLEIRKPALEQTDLWTFWTRNALILPNYFIVACTVALIPPSSAVCERLFARLVMGFGDDQESALEDYKATSTMMRFNKSLMKSNDLVPH